jgi:protocatechuate 3,4-dioxygenase beta subunit
MTDTRFNRRTALGMIGGFGALIALAACGKSSDSSSSSTSAPAASSNGGASTPSTASGPGTSATTIDCVLAPELTEGPYYLDLDDIRSDITEDRDGLAFALTMKVVDAEKCEPIKDAAVDIWHCDAVGSYSGVEGESGTTYLRGTQITDANGDVTFNTVYPGWYGGRAVHIHTKVHVNNSEVHTGQLFFDEELNETIYEQNAPYSSRGLADTPNADDSIYNDAGTNVALVRASEDGGAYRGTVTVGVQV